MIRPVLAEMADAVERLSAEIGAEIADGRLTLPVLPNVAAEVLASSVDERADASRLATLIQRDQSLASHVLRVCNSAAFRGASEIVSLQQAIARLGMLRIREMALSASLKGTLFRGGVYQPLADRLWREALAAGLWAREFARAARKSVEIAYLCGLLHRVGAPVVLHRLGEGCDELDIDQVAALLARLDRPAGVSLGWAWSLPPPVCAAIEHLGEPNAAGRHAELVATAACGALLARGIEDPQRSLGLLLALPAIRLLNLYPEDVERLLTRQADIELSVDAMVL
jgi:HD-like signal output (HDOD) protein